MCTRTSALTLILYTAPRAATAARGDREVAKPPSGSLREPGSRRERISDVKVLHCGSIEMQESFNALCDYRPALSSTNVRGRRLALGTTAQRSPPMHRRAALKASLLAFWKKDESLAADWSNR